MSTFDKSRRTFILYPSTLFPVNFPAVDEVLTPIQTEGAVRGVEAKLPSATSKSRQNYSFLTKEDWKHLIQYSLVKARSKSNRRLGLE